MIVAEGLTKYYGQVAALEEASFSIGKGEIIGFLGPNGAGKTTTMRILTGFTPPSRGRALIGGADVNKQPIETKRCIGYLPESVPLYGEMLVSSFLNYVAEIKGVPSTERRVEVDRVMDRCGLMAMARRVIRHLSKGYRQRVGLAQALLGNPPVLILDEPTVGLDPAQIIEIRRMIMDLGQDHTVLLSTHILPEVTMVCQRVLIINKGRIVAQDTMKNLASPSGELEIEVTGAPSTVTSVMQKLPEVLHFTVDGNVIHAKLTSTGEPIPSVTKALVEAGVGVAGLRKRTQTLEDIFLRIVSGETSPVNGSERDRQ